MNIYIIGALLTLLESLYLARRIGLKPHLVDIFFSVFWPATWIAYLAGCVTMREKDFFVVFVWVLSIIIWVLGVYMYPDMRAFFFEAL